MSKINPFDVAPSPPLPSSVQGWLVELASAPCAQEIPSWFARLARGLLHHMVLMVDHAPHDILEVEFYLTSPQHLDPFTHAHPSQTSCGRWYMHRQGQGFSNGTYKGLDVTFGPQQARGGVLIRTLRAPGGARVNGSCMCVDAIMERLGLDHVADLGACILPSGAFDPSSPVHIALRPRPLKAPIWPTSRVGLTLKRQAQRPSMPEFIARPYRMTTALDVPKGRVHTAVAMLKRGVEEQDIAQRVGTRPSHVRALARAYAQGQTRSPETFAHERLNAMTLAQLQGACDAAFGDPFFTFL